MILITKEESVAIRKLYPKAEMHRTCKQKSKRHRIYCPCVERYMRLIADTNIEAAAFISDVDEKERRKREYQQRTHNRKGKSDSGKQTK